MSHNEKNLRKYNAQYNRNKYIEKENSKNNAWLIFLGIILFLAWLNGY